MKGIISIKTNGVGRHLNSSVTGFPVQRMGLDIWPIHAVQNAQQTQDHEVFVGRSLVDELLTLTDGVESIRQLSECGAVIAGYQTDSKFCDSVCELVTRVKEESRQVLYVCHPELAEPIADKEPHAPLFESLMPMADVIVSSKYVLEQFTGVKISNVESATQACQKALEMGPKLILVTNIELEEHFTMMLATPKSIYLSQRPMLDFETPPAGVGDLTAVVFTACLVKRMSPVAALRHTNNAVYGVLELTYDNGSSELETIAGQYEFVEPTFDFPVKKLMALSMV
ncbi:pyridoxal kinase [Vibrio parahaemolyticus]|uniref:pyridoxal kinase n=1 Tax=Vibrio parahaemolyticus TaxID=670 RepID=UPI00211A7579|nr:pyridoxal kinase [Vibrio parahaemolyticus]MCQ9093278.1 pyridoxal kinase [Vibrio parahaemolyticus]MCZ6401444.1 pyridoxal kinase [Vibrio parahaemolyticus]